MERYLRPTRAIDSDNRSIREKAIQLTSRCATSQEKAMVLFNYVRDDIRYNIYMVSARFEDFIASTILSYGKGYCVQKAVLLTALARAVGIPSRLIFAKIRNHRAPAELVAETGLTFFPSHGYTQIFINGKWISVTPAFDKELCERIGVPPCEFDGEHDAILQDKDLHGNPYIEYLEKYEPQEDLPFEWLRAKIVPIWGEKRSWLYNEDSRGYRMPSGYVFDK